MTTVPRNEQEILLASILKKPREFVIAHPEDSLRWRERLRFWHSLHQRKRGVPIAYLTRKKEFFGIDFFVNRHVLIPRPETELLVEQVVARIRQEGKDKKIILVDIGTGSGCIPLAIMKTLNNKNIQAIAIDKSRNALRVAKKNTKQQQARMILLRGNLLEPFAQYSRNNPIGSPLIITANLPYLTKEQYADEPSIKHEPRSALVANKSGLALYEQLLKQIQQLTMSYEVKATCYFEIDPSQSDRIKSLVTTFLPGANVEIKKDLGGRNRVVCISTMEKSEK